MLAALRGQVSRSGQLSRSGGVHRLGQAGRSGRPGRGWLGHGLAVGSWLSGWWLLWRVLPVSGAAGVLPEPGPAPGQQRGGARGGVGVDGGRAGAAGVGGGDGEPAGGVGVATAGRGASGVTVIIPARDEERRLPALLASLAGQRPRPDEVVVVDDGSTDATAEVARAWGARVVTAPTPPPGWAGKPWALVRGVEATSGDWLVFLDADCRLAPGGLAVVLAEAGRLGGLLSVEPYHEVPRFGERLAAFCNLTAMMGAGAFSAAGGRRSARVAFGPCLVTRREDYLACGGHGVAPGAVLDDAALAGAYRRARLPVAVRAGGRAVSFRMYPEGLGSVVEGFTKNLAAGAQAIAPASALAVAWWVTGATSAALGVGRMLGSGPRARSKEGSAPVAVVAYAGYAAQVALLLRRIGSWRLADGLLYPLSLATFLVVFSRSVLATLRGRARWKGRDVPLARAPRVRPPGVRQPVQVSVATGSGR